MLATYGLQRKMPLFRKDPYSGSVSFLYNGTDAIGNSFGTNIISSPNISAINGGLTISSSNFGQSMLDCTNNKTWAAQGSLFNVGGNNFSCEFFVYNISRLYEYNDGFQISDGFWGANTIGYEIAVGHAAYGANNYQVYSPINGVINTGVAITYGNWEFWQIIRNGASINFYKNGILIYADNVGINFNWSGKTINTIQINNTVGNNNFNGYCNGIRFTKNVNRPVANEIGPFLYP